MKKFVTLHIRIIIAVMAVFSIVYYLLLRDSFLHMSISAIISHANTLELKRHLLVLGLLPVYIATMIFGSVMLTIGLSSVIKQSFQLRSMRKQQPTLKQT